ncbi:hypothetical protein ABIB35_000589 [Arthrobacter sp. UYP6]|uniref:hypothetical protein n=1 Tax=Arthrobacter sp. UYP6 TaxID=1756378 RepID=UPI00339B039E
MAFVLTLVLGAGSTIAYAYWSQSTPVAISGTTRSEVPAGTSPVTVNPALAPRPATPSEPTCAAVLSDLEMRPNSFADVRFSWAAGAAATSYVITVKSAAAKYDQTQTVNATQANFRFGRLPSDRNGKPVGSSSPFYTKYTVRVMPMNGTVAGDPLYFTYEYEHYKSNNCYYSDPTGAAPLGDIQLACSLPPFDSGTDYVQARFTWSGSSGAKNYLVTMTAQNGSGYGGEQVVTADSAAFSVLLPKPAAGNAPYYGRYTIRVQPMKGVVAGDPRYLTYQLGANSHECWIGR